MKIRSALREFSRIHGQGLIAAGLGAGVTLSTAHAAEPIVFTYETLNFGTDSTFLTGIRGDNIVGDHVISGTTETGGLYYNLTTKTWSPMPVSTSNGANFPGAIGSSPYGPSFGTPEGILRVVGSYQTEASAPYDLSYLYDGAAAPGQQITNLIYPSGAAGQTLYTIAHSNFGNQVVGDYDTDLATGNAFIYNMDTGTFSNNNIAGAISTTAYGIYGDKIAGGYSTVGDLSGPVFEHGYIYDQTDGTYVTYDHDGAIGTHFEGITGAGRAGEYNLVADWISPDGATHPAVLHVAADGSTTWYEIDIPGEVVSSNSAYGDNVVGVYLADGKINGYVATIPGMYNPIRNESSLTVSANGATGIATNPGGDDVINSAPILVSGNNSVGIQGQTYGVITNTSSITTTGAGSSGVQMSGTYGTLLNYGTMTASPGAFAISTGASALGTVVVNSGVIDGAVDIEAGPYARFENSGWLGITAAGSGVTQQISGIFAQTSAGTLGLRIGDGSYDSLHTDTARLAGTLAASFDTDSLLKRYTVVSATQEITGAFEALETSGLPDLFAAWLGYTPTDVTLNVAAALAALPGNTPNQQAVGSAIDGIINNTGNNTLAALPEALAPLYALDTAQLPAALGALSGEGYASEQSIIVGDSFYSRQAVLGRLRQGSYAGQSGAMASLSDGGPTLAYGEEAKQPASVAALGYVSKDGAAEPKASGATLWGQVYGGWADLNSGSDLADVSESIGGIISGADIGIDDWRVGAALGYSQSNADVGELGNSFKVDSLLLAAYAGTKAGPVNVRLGASYAFNQINSDRLIAYPGYLQQASAQYNGGTAQAFGELGYGFAVQKVALEPFVGLAYVNVNTDGFSETGAAAGLNGSSMNSGVGYSTLGLRAATSLAVSGGMVLQPRASLAWQYAFGDLSPTAQMAFVSAPGASFSVSGVPLAENTALVELGADLLVNPKARVGLSYVGQFAEDVSDNSVQANFSLSF
ncbi:autotransporter outer membrane beta-barrel domain-containing protein [Kaistia algarum]|uniref:autotransporter outer membrane beta-barrel domain-containing protein n=1 Tax=Kaistia algarum TaxID=2083279 RepID=UPI000CE7BB87|nr:autotransporter outer membrane beta-barrel domain-containing protein [Kaistia algarum]MCX5514875.1 autotransporter domain-containing protein [Kaistia algarum]PPE79627.1 autotransporter outer membrane beta-barrel domain-containing protein [Kaistia algarum]